MENEGPNQSQNQCEIMVCDVNDTCGCRVGRKNIFHLLLTNVFNFDILHFCHEFESYLKIFSLLDGKSRFSITPERREGGGKLQGEKGEGKGEEERKAGSEGRRK